MTVLLECDTYLVISFAKGEQPYELSYDRN